ncbi:MAG: hypothetical protein ACRD3J_05720 [Thermoanaerobaculia bacterium]
MKRLFLAAAACCGSLLLSAATSAARPATARAGNPCTDDCVSVSTIAGDIPNSSEDGGYGCTDGDTLQGCSATKLGCSATGTCMDEVVSDAAGAAVVAFRECDPNFNAVAVAYAPISAQGVSPIYEARTRDVRTVGVGEQ